MATETLSLTARIVNLIRKCYFSSYNQVGSSGERGVCTSFCGDLMKVSGGGAATYLDFITQKMSFPPSSFSSIVFVNL